MTIFTSYYDLILTPWSCELTQLDAQIHTTQECLSNSMTCKHDLAVVQKILFRYPPSLYIHMFCKIWFLILAKLKPSIHENKFRIQNVCLSMSFSMALPLLKIFLFKFPTYNFNSDLNHPLTIMNLHYIRMLAYWYF